MREPTIATDSQAEFDQLQKKLVPLWKSIERLSQDPQTIVVVPSMSIDAINSGAVMQAYEERFLFLLLLLRQPRARLIYVTSQTILLSIIDYYLGLLPGVIPSHARQRLFRISPLDLSARPLSDTLLYRPRLIELTALPAPRDSKEKAMLEERLRAMQFELAGATYESYMKKLQERKGVVEA